MTAPNILSIQHDGLTLRIIFDIAVTGTPAQELDGFTFTKTPGPVVVSPTFSAFDENAIVCTLPGVVLPSETLTVDYNNGVGTIVDAATGLDAATSFTGQVAVETYSTPIVRRAQVAATAVNDELTVFFGEPIASPTNDPLAGFTIEVDNVALDLTGATWALNDDLTELTINVGSNFAYNDVVDVIYDDVTGDLYSWPSGVVASFTLDAIDNDSTDGLPDSEYPLSSVIAQPLDIVDNVVNCHLGVSLNPIDIQLVARYGPVQVFTGGTYGITVGNPSGITVDGSFVDIIDGAELAQTFNDPCSLTNAVDAGKDWLDQITAKIGIALGEARAKDQSITLGDLTITSV
jgi:hypothetical protein